MAKKRWPGKDRTARLYKLEHLLSQNPQGMSPNQLADRCGVSVRTVYRDREALETHLHIPISQDGDRWLIDREMYLPPIRLTLPEATALFLAARLALSYSNRFDPNFDATFTKLNTVVPPPLRKQIERTLVWMQGLKKDPAYSNTVATLSQALRSGCRVKIRYSTLGEDAPKERIIEPYAIQPSFHERANYVVAFCRLAGEIRTFKVERIKNIELLDAKYEIPSEFDVNKYFGQSWGVIAGFEPETVKLRFNPDIAQIAAETIWHPSQTVAPQPDGSAVVTLTVAPTIDFQAWVLGWGEKVEVLEPARLRREIA